MQLSRPTDSRAGRESIGCRVLPLVAAVLVAALAAGGPHAHGQIPVPAPGVVGPRPGEADATGGVYLPTDRTLSRAIARAKERLAQREYHEALAFLHGLLGRKEDWFLESGEKGREQIGIKATARKLIGDLPPEGLDVYELLHGATARRQLEAALRAGDRNEISQVVRQYYHTRAGYEAALVLAQMEADQGHRLAAAQLYRQLIDTPRAAAQFEPQLSVLAALNDLAAGNREACARTLRSLVERHPSATIALAGKTSVVPSADGDLTGWLVEFVGRPTSSPAHSGNWLNAGGAASRNTETSGGRPHLRPRWEARVINDPAIEAYFSGRTEDYQQRGVVVVPGARPIAVGDTIVMRTPENVVAVDWHTGKRVWETREDDELSSEARNEFQDQFGQVAREQWPGQQNPLEERVWDDALAASLSSDGERVFVLRNVSISEEEQMMGWRVGPGLGRLDGDFQPATNQLAAYDVSTQGKLVWELDGSRAAAPLDGAFFLGAPLAIDNTLYVMAEVRSAIYLFALEPATGRVVWQQQLVGLEQSVGLDSARRHAGATPSYDAGMLICPTGAGAVVAIDVVKREFAWVYRYPQEPQTPVEMRNIWQNQAQATTMRANNDWLDSAAILGEGHVVITPAESSELHCIDLRTGKLVWKKRRGDSLFVSGLHGGVLLVAGAESVRGLRIHDGANAWAQESVSLPSGALPAGHGYFSEGHYYLPLTSGDIAAIVPSDGKLEVHEAALPGATLGNLICFRGSVVSQSSLLLDRFEQLDVLQQRVEKMLATNANDATAIRELAELKRTAGETAEAVRLLKKAYELTPRDVSNQELLSEVLLAALADDYAAFRSDVPLLRQIVHDPEQQVELMRIVASGLDESGERLAAVDAYLDLADFTAEEPVQLLLAPSYSARSDRWIGGQLASVWSKADADQRATILERIASRRPRLENPRTAAELRHYLAHLGELPGAAEVRQALVGFLIDRKRTQEAEIELLALANTRETDERAVAALSARLAAALQPVGNKAETEQRWPRGRVESELISAAASTAESRLARAQAERQTALRQLRIEQDTSLVPTSADWFIATDCSELVRRDRLGNDVYRLTIDQNNWTRPAHDSSLAYGGRLGSLLFVTLGGQILAISSPSTHSEAGDVLWRTDPLGRYATEPQARISSDTKLRGNRRPAYHKAAGRRRMAGVTGPGACSLGPITPRGVIFQEQERLQCVDPATGELLWARADIPAGCELIGDYEYVLAADVGARVAYVLRLVDGQLVGKRDLPKYEWLVTAGRNVTEYGLIIDGEHRAAVIRISDLLSGESLFDQEYPLDTRVSVLEPESIAVFQSSGKFQLIDARSGKLEIDQQLEPLEDVSSVGTMAAGDKVFVFVSTKTNDQQFKPLVQQADYPLVNGMVYAFERRTGRPLWPGPAVVRNRGIVLGQPRDVPFLIFADRRMVRDASSGGGSHLRLLCLDQDTGQTVYSNDSLPDTSITRFRIRGEIAAEPTVAIEMNAGKIQLTLSDRPRPPQPPANDDLEARRAPGSEGGLMNLGRRMSSVLQGMQSPAEQARTRQQREIELARQRVKEAERARLERMQREKEKENGVAPEIDDD